MLVLQGGKTNHEILTTGPPSKMIAAKAVLPPTSRPECQKSNVEPTFFTKPLEFVDLRRSLSQVEAELGSAERVD